MARQHGQQPGSRSGTSNRGFASMDENQQREIARMGGAAVSENREHMAAIGRKGGEASAESRANLRALNQAAKSRDDTAAVSDARRGEDQGAGLGGSLGDRSGSDDERLLGTRRNPGNRDNKH
jgi:general stress protein YciG